MDTEHVLCIASTRSCLLHPGLPVTLAQMHPPGKSGWNHRELAKAAGSRWPNEQQQQQHPGLGHSRDKTHLNLGARACHK